MTIIGDGIVRSKDLEWNQIIAFALIVAPTFALMVMRFLNIIREWVPFLAFLSLVVSYVNILYILSL